MEESDAPAVIKAIAKDANQDSAGTNLMFEVKTPRAAAGTAEARSVGNEMARQQDVTVEEDSDEEDRTRGRQGSRMVELAKGNENRPLGKSTRATVSTRNDVPESAAERRRREKALRGVDNVTDEQRGRSPTRHEAEPEHQETAADRRRRLALERGGSKQRTVDPSVEGESAAERRRREAALGVGIDGADDSDDDDTPRVPPVAKIRFAQSPVRGRR